MGIYKLEETDYPDGYITLTEGLWFRVNDDLTITLLDGDGNEIEGNQSDNLRVVDNTATIIVGNTPGSPLPSSGGPGTTTLRFLGIFLISIVALAVFAMRKKIFLQK